MFKAAILDNDVSGQQATRLVLQTWLGKKKIANELYLMDSPTKVDPPTGISQVMMDDVPADAPQYNLQGQRVDRSWKGIVIQGGRKRVNK